MQVSGFSAVDSAKVKWRPSEFAQGVHVKDLAASNGFTMQLVRFDPGVRFPFHHHAGPEFIFVLAGSARQRGVLLSSGWAGAACAGTEEDDFESVEGCTFLLLSAE